jgi:hypothetical protein
MGELCNYEVGQNDDHENSWSKFNQSNSLVKNSWFNLVKMMKMMLDG